MRRRSWLRAASLFALATASYIGLLCQPEPLFAYSLREGSIMLHYPAPLPRQARDVARDADARIASSPLYDARVVHHIYVADTPLRFAILALHRYQAAGVAYGGLTQNVFLRPVTFAHNRVIRADGSLVPGERTLSYFIAHEAVHGMLSSRLGRLGYLRLPTWKNEGYADYVAKAGAFDYARELQRLHAGAVELDPARSRLYLRYQLSVSYWLQKRGLSVEQLLTQPLPPGP